MASDLSSRPTKVPQGNLTSFPTKLGRADRTLRRADQILTSVREPEHRLYLECTYLASQSKWLSDDRGSLGLIRLQVTLRVSEECRIKWMDIECRFDGAEITNDIQTLVVRGNLSERQTTIHCKLAPEMNLNVAGSGGSLRIGDAEWDHVRGKHRRWRFQCERRSDQAGHHSLYSMEFRGLNTKHHEVEPFRVCLTLEHEELPIPVSVHVEGRVEKGRWPFRVRPIQSQRQGTAIQPRHDMGSLEDEIIAISKWVREPTIELVESEFRPIDETSPLTLK